MPRAKKEEPKERNRSQIVLGGRELTLSMPRGRKGRQGVAATMKVFEQLADRIGASGANLDALSMVDTLKVARALFEDPSFEEQTLPFVVMNTDAGFETLDEAVEFLDEIGDSLSHIMEQFFTAMAFFLGGPNAEAVEEAMGKSSGASEGTKAE